ncbi:multidrug effflux MFS transporter [Aestuariispira insulae]|uniref:Bcr/CflA family efflux transporter n=1 Tax=Aestuariispira insulae TaxID=1461337 RepID=A0A3D9HRL7_9PROT|nr:multidrug effflux MFS transporter [Aestuariispira insulae]RED52154.1 DHA1 family bicyclomycin/chloramphenicol resistance-like MFS transporter [Aestuariispira insulae]
MTVPHHNAARRSQLTLPEFIALFALITSLTALSIDTMLPALPVIGEALGLVDMRDTQLIVSMVILGMVAGELFAGPLSDALGRRPVILAGIAVYCLGAVLAMVAQSIEMLLFARFIQGIGVSGPKIASRALIRDRFEGDGMARIMSLIIMIFILVPAIAPALGQVILLVADWRAIFLVFLILGAVVAVWFGLRQEETLPQSARRPFRPMTILKDAGGLLGHRIVMAYTLSAGLIFGSLLLFLSTAPHVFRDLYGIEENFPIYFAALALGIGFAGMVNSKLVLRVGARRLSLIALVNQIICGSVLLWLGQAHGGVPPLSAFMILMFLLFAGLGCLFGNLNALAMRPLGHMAGLGASFIASFSSIMAFLTATLIGRFYDGTVWPLAAGFLGTSILALIAMRVGRHS